MVEGIIEETAPQIARRWGSGGTLIGAIAVLIGMTASFADRGLLRASSPAEREGALEQFLRSEPAAAQFLSGGNPGTQRSLLAALNFFTVLSATSDDPEVRSGAEIAAVFIFDRLQLYSARP